MAMIPTSPLTPVQTTAMPGARLNPNAPQDAFAAPPKIPDLSGVQRAVGDVYEQARQHADQVAILDAHNRLTQLRDQILYDPQSGVLNQKGINALGAASSATQAWRDGASQIENGLATDDQKLRFRQLAAMQWSDASSDVERHVGVEMANHDQATTMAALDNVQNDILHHVDDPTRVQQLMDQGTMIAEGFAARRGYSPEQTQAMVASLTSKAHMGVLTSLTDQERDLDATKYFQQHRDALQGQDLLDAEKLVGLGSVRALSQQQADAIIQQGGSLTDMVARAESIQDPRVRDATALRIRQHFADQARDQNEEAEQAYHQASAFVEQGQSVPLSLRLKLSPTQNGDLDRRQEQLRNPVRTSNVQTFNGLVNMAALSPATRQWFEHENLLPYRGQLSDEDFRYVMNLQERLRLSTMGGEVRDDKKTAKEQQQYDAKEAFLRGKMSDSEITKLLGQRPGGTVQPQTPNVPGAPITYDPQGAIPPAAQSAGPQPQHQTGWVTTRVGSVTQRIPASWVQLAQIDHAYREYLATFGIAIPASASVP